MLTRRRFLAYGAASILAASGGCRPTHSNWDENELSNAESHLSLDGRRHLADFKNRLLGYPVNMNTPPEAFFEWRRQLFDSGIGRFAYNNVGNPFKASPIPFNTHDFERELIANFAKVYAFPADDAWGFLSHSGTDSNMHGMYMGRTILKGRTGKTPKAYFTQEAHYSIQILRDLLGLEGVVVGTLPDGAMDTEDLKRKLAENPGEPALVVATVGTTFKGAIDPIDSIQAALAGVQSFVHVDAALFGGYLPYTAHAAEVAFRSSSHQANTRYDSIAVSCHKFFGFPSPAGLFITTASRFEEFNHYFSKIHNPEYIHHVPGTITCSRDAVKPAEFYFFSTTAAADKLAQDAELMLENAAYFLEQMQSGFPQLTPIRANPLSNTVYFKCPGTHIVQKYSLATMLLTMAGQQHECAHVVVMPHVSRAVLAEFMDDLETAH